MAVLWYGSAEYSKTETKNESSRIEQRNPDGHRRAPFPKVRFAMDSPLEGEGFEPSVPRQKDNAFRDSSFPTCARATAAFENARRPSSSCFFQL